MPMTQIKMRQIEVLDSTLREGEQHPGISFSTLDKCKIINILNDLGITYVEIPSSLFGPNNEEFLSLVRKMDLSIKPVIFGRTCKPDVPVEKDESIKALLESGFEYVALYGKCWKEQIKAVLRTTLEENDRMIYESVKYLVDNGKKVFFDAEHFFDGYADDKEFVFHILKLVRDAGASAVCLCDTRGGSFPDFISECVKEVKKRFDIKIAIHTHNDGGMADASTCAAVFAGADQIQGTLNGIGERCGNSNLATCIANLQLKKDYRLIPPEKMSYLTKSVRALGQTCNLSTSGLPYVSRTAFSHKAGTHIDAVMKEPSSFEHIDPSSVGNKRNILISGLSGKSTLMPIINTFLPNLSKDSPESEKILEVVKEHESLGYQYESAHASLELMVRKVLGIHKSHFTVERFKLFTEQTELSERNAEDMNAGELKANCPSGLSSAFVKISVGDKFEMTAAESDGPVSALDLALRKALYVFYPELKSVSLVDFKVRIIDGSKASDAIVRVIMDTSDGNETYTTIGVSADIIEASKQALIDSLEYALYKKDKTQLS